MICQRATSPLQVREFLYYKYKLDLALDPATGQGLYYDHKDIPGLVPMIILGTKLELISRPGFSQPPRGLYREIIRYISEDLKIEYKTIGPPGKEKITVADEPLYFNPEAIRAARMVLQDASCYQYTRNNGIQFIYHPSKLMGKSQKELHVNKTAGGWVHLASFVELMKVVVIRHYNDVPFYFLALTRLVPWEFMQPILFYATLTESAGMVEVGVDSTQRFWVRYLVRDQDVFDTRPITGTPTPSPYPFAKDGIYYKKHPYLWT